MSAGSDLDEARVKAMSRAALEAYDQADEDAANDMLASNFVWILDKNVRDRNDVLTGLHARKSRAAPQRSRVFRDERVWITGATGVYLGESIEHIPPEGARLSGEFQTATTLVWAREGTKWKLASVQLAAAGVSLARSTWDEIYRQGKGWNAEPNRFLKQMTQGRAPGRALDVGMGQGRNALYLASRGWQVTGIDISEEGLRQARAAAVAKKLAVEAINADAETWNYGVEQWDLVALIYASGDLAGLKAGLKKGGLVIAEYFHKDAVPHIGTDPAELADSFKDGFDILHNEIVEDVSDWGNQDGIKQKLVRFAARKR